MWHAHADTDDVFLVLSGRVTIQLRTGDVELEAGEMFESSPPASSIAREPTRKR